MTPEREAQMREMFEALASEWGWDLRRETNDPNEYLLMSTAAAWGGFLACARALEPMVSDGEMFKWLCAKHADHDECEWFVYGAKSNDLRFSVLEAMSAALEEEKNANQ